MTPLLPLNKVRESDRSRVGGKAYMLARLVGAGLPVPDGRVVPTDLLREHLRQNGLLDEAAQLNRILDAERLERFRVQLAETLLSEPLRRALKNAVRALGGMIAVRSSGRAEDGQKQSFAGQHQTCLGVGEDDVAAAVLEVWCSLWSSEALAYRKGRGPAPEGMAVLLQRQLAPVVSGVMFTVNPLNGSWREMVVEATWGLGDALVSGRVAPHWFLVRRPRNWPRLLGRVASRVRLEIMQEELPEIEERWVVREGVVVREPCAERGPTLDRRALRRLCRLGLKVERRLGAPQDIEWARGSDGRFMLLQARPITARGTPRTRTDVLWTRRFLGERWPEPASPLGWSIIEPLLNWFIAYPETQRRYLGGGAALKLLNARPYVNVTVFRHLAFKLPGAPAPRFMLELIPPDEEQAWRERFSVMPDVSVYASLLRETLEERRWRRFRWNPFTNHLHWRTFRDRLEEALPLVSRPPSGARDAVALVETQIALIRDYITIHICSLLFANLWYQLLDGALAAWVPERSAVYLDALGVCPPGNLTLAANEALWEVARLADAAGLEELEQGALPPVGTLFGDALRAFLEEYGHRSASSWEIFSPRWREHPELLVPLLRAQAKASTEPMERARLQQRSYEEALSKVGQTLSGPRGTAVLALVHYTRSYLLLRENQRFWFDRLLHAVQTTLYTLGDHFVTQEILASREEVAFLTWSEVKGLVSEGLDPKAAKGWVTRRRAVREEAEASLPPVFLRGDEGVPNPSGGRRLEGLGISAGRARGCVRVLNHPREGDRLERGDILVARSVDPAWTPLFLTAGAVVLELGSVLSHGAVVAREYGVPAVVNLDGVTVRLKEGQEVTVDGTRGIVWVHP